MAITFIAMSGSILMLFIVLGVHELGHLITGILQGFRFELFVVGPLGIKRENNKTKVYLNKNLAHYGGLASNVPVNDHPENSRKLAFICLAGPVASILLAAILGILHFPFDFQFSHILLIGALASAGIFLVTTIPGKQGCSLPTGNAIKDSQIPTLRERWN